jgi:hypothetical protein
LPEALLFARRDRLSTEHVPTWDGTIPDVRRSLLAEHAWSMAGPDRDLTLAAPCASSLHQPVRAPQVFLLSTFQEELVYKHLFAHWQAPRRVRTEPHRPNAILHDCNQVGLGGNTIDAVWSGQASHLEIAVNAQLLELACRKELADKLVGSRVGISTVE